MDDSIGEESPSLNIVLNHFNSGHQNQPEVKPLGSLLRESAENLQRAEVLSFDEESPNLRCTNNSVLTGWCDDESRTSRQKPVKLNLMINLNA